MTKTDIPMVNLHAQYLSMKEEIDAAVLDTIASTMFINGPQVKQFEENFARYLGVKHVISCANGTDALQIAIMALEYEAGDEIITPSFTYAATAEVIALLGLTPVFVDVDPDTFTIDTKKLEKSITAKTRAILPVHLFGAAANMDQILSVANKYGLHVIEDTAQAPGAIHVNSKGVKSFCGTMGTIGTYSFFPSKNLGCYGDGGAVATNDDQLAEKVRMISRHGQSAKYVHDVIGCNSRLDSIQAAILNVKLPHLDRFNAKRQAAAENYNRLLENIEGIQTPINKAYSQHIYHQYTIKVDGDRNALADHLSKNGIGCAVYYPIPLHMQKAFMSIPNRKGDLTVTEEIKDKVISLPIDTEITIEQQEYIIETIKQFITK